MDLSNNKRLPLLLLLAALLGGCVSVATERMAGHIADAMLNQPDPEIVRSGAPAYLLLLDSMIAATPSDHNLLVSAAQLYGAYSRGLVTKEKRRKKLAKQAMEYADRAFCPGNKAVCAARNQPYAQFSKAAARMDTGDLQALFTYAASWLGFIEANRDDWNAIANLPKVELLLQRVVDITPGFAQGRAQLYLAMLRTLLPASMGGNPEQGKQHFELAIRYSEEKDLMAKVAYAERYARLVYDQQLHDRLLHEVLAADPEHPGLTLSNVLAQQQAALMMNDEYF